MIPVNEPLMAQNTLKYVTDCIETGWISSAGSYIRRFEEKFAEYLGVKHAVTTTSGTSALHLALMSCEIGPGDGVLVPSLTMIAVPYAVLYTGAQPLPVDVENETFNLHAEAIDRHLKTHCLYDRQHNIFIDKKTETTIKAILPVHLYGHPCAMTEIQSLADKYHLLIIEDAAEAHGAMYTSPSGPKKPKFAGAIGDMGCFSFYANKIITTGEGGMVVTQSDAYAQKARGLKDLAHAPGRRFLHTELAYNYRMTNVQAAIGLSQLEEINRYIQIKRDMAADYHNRLNNLEGIRLPIEQSWARDVYWMYAIVVEDEFGINRDQLMLELKKRGIDTRTFFIPFHKQPLFQDMYSELSLPVSEDLSERGLYLPSGLALTKDQVKTVCETLWSIKTEIG